MAEKNISNCNKKDIEEEISSFMNGALILWLESCLPRPEILTGYQSLFDGVIINSVCLQIDPEPQNHLVKTVGLEGAALVQARCRNFCSIVKNLKTLYEEELGQTVLMLPDCSVLGREPETKRGVEQMKLLLTLLLGAAVQCPNKEIFIARIKELELEIQVAIVELIKCVTDDQKLVLSQENFENLRPDIMCQHIVRLAKERDQYHSNWILSLNLEGDDQTPNRGKAAQLTAVSSNSSTTSQSSSSENNHLAVELADMKSKLRKVRQELEEKSEALMEVKEDLEHKASQYEKLRLESQEWYAEARKSAAYRDEADVLRERADRVERLELDLQRMREKLADAEFYKSRVEELREDNRMLLETKEMLEEQLLKSRKRSEHVMSLESEIIKYKQKLNDLTLERDVDKSKLQDLLEENAQLQLTAKNLVSANDLSLSAMSLDSEEGPTSGDNSLSEQLSSNAQSRVLKLELENRRLLATLESYKETSFQESSNKILELEKDKKRLSLKLDQVQDNCNRLVQQNSELEDVFKNALEENKKLQDALDTKQQNVDKYIQDREIDRSKISDLEQQIETITKEKQRVQNLSESIQRRADDLSRTVEIKTKECEEIKMRVKDLDTVKTSLYESESKLAVAERDVASLTKEVAKLKESLEMKEKELDENLVKIETQAKEMQGLLKTLDETKEFETKIQSLEKFNQELKSQRKVDEETITTLQKDLVSETLAKQKLQKGLDKLGLEEQDIDKQELTVETFVEKLVKNPETFKTVREVMLNVGKNPQSPACTSSTMCVLCHKQEIFTVEKDIEFTTDHVPPQNIPTVKPKGKVVVNLEMNEAYPQLKAENDHLQICNESLEAENARQKVEVATLQSQITSLSTQQVALQLANSQLAAEKDSLVKQLDVVKTNNAQLHQDHVSMMCLHEQLGSEYDALNKEKELLKIENRDLKTKQRELKESHVTLEKMVQELKSELDTMRQGNMNLGNLRAEHSRLKDDFRNLFSNSERLKQEYKNIHEQYRNLRNENGHLKLKNTELSGEMSLQSERVRELECELTKANNQCEMLFQLNSSLDIDRKTLMEHVSQLLAQYHELLSHSLEDKQHYHDEEKNFNDKVNHLYRQKEKLEEKIMEHYRKLENCSPKKKTFGSSFVNKVRKAINRVPNRNPRSWIEDPRISQSQFNLGSESGGNESDNSNEEPSNAATSNFEPPPPLPPPLSRNSQLRQSLQRKPMTDGANVNPLLRGGIRSSLQSSSCRDITQSHRNSFPSIEPPDITGNSLGQPGTRRTVYLIDETQKLSENGPANNTGTSTTPGNEGAQTQNATEPTPNTFLMFNKISNVTLEPTSSVNTNGNNDEKGNASDTSSKNGGKNKKNDSKNRESAIWYEYGCV